MVRRRSASARTRSPVEWAEITPQTFDDLLHRLLHGEWRLRLAEDRVLGHPGAGHERHAGDLAAQLAGHEQLFRHLVELLLQGHEHAAVFRRRGLVDDERAAFDPSLAASAGRGREQGDAISARIDRSVDLVVPPGVERIDVENDGTVEEGVEFFQRKEIRDILGYLQLLANPSNDE